uniref:LAM_G_DOMAIN domain-containing protein n=1 Tax=Heterorhabditis bacteriophora TaxID=37862 RepID=A0A1I7WE57_HETBA
MIIRTMTIRKEKLRSDNVKPGEEYTITVIRKGPKTEFLVNGRAFESKKSLSSFVSGTNIFIGGLPPGVETPESQPEQSFRGCISQVSFKTLIFSCKLIINIQFFKF